MPIMDKKVQSAHKSPDNSFMLSTYESFQSFWNIFSEGNMYRASQALVQVRGTTGRLSQERMG